MKKNISLESQLNRLFRRSQYHSNSVSEQLAAENDLSLLNQLKKIAPKNFHVNDIGDILDLTSGSNSSFYNRFIDNLKAANTNWVAVCPIVFKNVRKNEYLFEESFNIGLYSIVPACTNALNFISIVKQKYGCASTDINTVIHYEKTGGNFLFSHPLLTFTIEGSPLFAKQRITDGFRRYKAVQETFFACFDKAIPFTLSEKVNRNVYMINIKNGGMIRVPYQQGTTICGIFSEISLSKMKTHGIGSMLSSPKKSKKKFIDRLLNAAFFFSKGLNESDYLSKFIFYVICLESIFSRDNNIPLRVSLADYCALLCFKKQQRLQIHDTIKDIYDKRSEIVHSGLHSISPILVEKTENIAIRAIQETLKFYMGRLGHTDVERAFFEYLLELKMN